MKLVLASSNVGKITELSALLKDFNIEFIPQSQLNIGDAEETGLTFVENAIIKARHAALASGLPAIADDSGLVVKALHGAPGIYSARYAGKQATDSDNRKKLLMNLKDTPETERQAYFYCVLVYLSHANDPTPIICSGSWQGFVLQQEQGDNGFGYDPIFFVPSEKKSAAELPSALKNKISHRGMALQALLGHFQKMGKI